MKKYVSFELDNEVYQLRFGVNEMCDMEDLLNKPVSALGQNAGMKELRVMFYCGLRGTRKDITLEDTGVLMSEVIADKGIDFLQDVLAKAMELALGNSTPSPKAVKKA